MNELYRARAVIHQHNAAMSHAMAADSLARGFYNSAVYWQEAARQSAADALEIMGKLINGR